MEDEEFKKQHWVKTEAQIKETIKQLDDNDRVLLTFHQQDTYNGSEFHTTINKDENICITIGSYIKKTGFYQACISPLVLTRILMENEGRIKQLSS
jgi:hypothetical protein